MTDSAGNIDTKRFDGDSWDLASSVGATATAVAARRALASKGPNPLIDDPFAEPLVNAVGVDAFIQMMNGKIELAEDDPAFTPQRLSEGMAVRTRFFDSFFLDAAEAGVRQAVILASGLDTRAYRLPWPAGTVLFEVDQPQVIEFKTRTLAGLGAAPKADRRAVGVDLRDDWPAALRDSGFDPAQPTAWSAEGLLAYLPPDAQDRLFDNITALSTAGSRLGTGYVPDIRDRVEKRGRELSERWRRLAPARIIQKRSGKWRTPVVEHADEPARLDVLAHITLEGQPKAKSITRGALHETGIVRDQSWRRRYLHHLSRLLELPVQ